MCGHVKPLLYVYVLLLATQHGRFAPASYLVIGDSLEDNRKRGEVVRLRLFQKLTTLRIQELGKSDQRFKRRQRNMILIETAMRAQCFVRDGPKVDGGPS